MIVSIVLCVLATGAAGYIIGRHGAVVARGVERIPIVLTGAVMYGDQVFPCGERQCNRLTVLDPERILEGAIENDVTVFYSDDRVLGSYQALDDGTAYITVWGHGE